MGVTGCDFMQLSLKVVEKLKDEIRTEEIIVKKIEKIMRCPDIEDPKPSSKLKFLESLPKTTSFHALDFILPKSLCVRYIHTILCSPSHTMRKRIRQGKSTRGQSSSSREHTMEEKSFVSLYGSFSHLLSLIPLLVASTKSGLRRGETLKAEHVLMGFWPTIRGGEFVVRGIAVKKVRDPRNRLAHRCIATTISGRKNSTQRNTAIDLFYLYCIYGEGVACNIPYWLAWYLERGKDKDLIYGGMFLTRIARSLGFLTTSMVDALSVEPRAYVFRKK
nr:retrotransposon Orf1 [Tanacetum cinerariifolium]